MSQKRTDVVEVEVRIAARPETIFPFFTDPKKMVKWKGVKAELEPKPGGRYRVDINGRDIANGTFVQLEPFKRIVYTWGWEGEGSPVPPGSSTVEVTLIPDGKTTIVRLRYYDLPEPARETHKEGWKHYLGRLIEAGEGRDPGVDPMTMPAPKKGS